jgi:hypothetical protein
MTTKYLSEIISCIANFLSQFAQLGINTLKKIMALLIEWITSYIAGYSISELTPNK